MDYTKLDRSSVTSAAGISLRVIAIAVVVASLYYASSIFITLVCAMFIAFVLEPGVRLLERGHVPRYLGSLLMVLAALAVLYLVGYAVYGRAVDFIHDLPSFTAPIHHIVTHVEDFFARIHQSTTGIVPPSSETSLPTVRVQENSPWGRYLVRGIGSFYTFVVTVMFIPFLVFFMLTSRNQIWEATLNLFPIEEREQAEHVILRIGQMVRQYVLGNVLVALISAAIITPVFAELGLHFALLLGPLAALLSLIPYIGVALAIIPPLMVALVQFTTVTPFVVIAVTVVVVHFAAINFLTPLLVGHRVKLNALTVTIAMMFWGWLWGGIGLILAVPITAAVKAVCDNIEKLKGWGAWMGES